MAGVIIRGKLSRGELFGGNCPGVIVLGGFNGGLPGGQLSKGIIIKPKHNDRAFSQK